MKRRMRSKIYSLLVASVVMLCGAGSLQAQTPHRDSADFEFGRSIEILANMMREFDQSYVSRIDVDELLAAAADGISRITDPYSLYLSEEDMVGFATHTTGKYGGVGSTIRKRGDYVVFANPRKGSPADEAGIKPGDKILAINGKSMKGASVDEISDNLMGVPETDVEVTIERIYGSQVETLTIRRRQIFVPSVPYYTILRDGVGYITHNDFIKGSYDEMRHAIESLMAEAEADGGLKGLVLDYRSNGGGIMREAIDIVSLFVDRNERILSTMGRDSSSLCHFATQYAPIARDLPIVVLVNRMSASASEILAGSLQDLDRAVIMGQRTFGKGLVQSTAYLGYGTYLKYTTEKYYIPSGRCIQAHVNATRNSDGSVASVPDSLVREFATRGGRKVYDGGGIMPDVTLEPQYYNRFAYELLSQGYIFNWVDKYMCEHHDETIDVLSFRLSDEDYADFVSFMQDKELRYESQSRRALNALEKALAEEQYDEHLSDAISQIREQLKDDKLSNLQTYRKDIEDVIVMEIVSRYAYEEAGVAVSVQKDTDVARAVDLLLDEAEYRRLLTKQ